MLVTYHINLRHCASLICIFALLTKVCRGSGAKVVQKNIQVICRIITSGTLILSRRIGSHVEFDFRALRNWARAGMVEWNGIFRLFRFSGILGQPREVHPKFRNEIPENVCSIRSQTRNFRNFWSNGKRPQFVLPKSIDKSS